MCRSRTAIPPALTLKDNASMNIYLQQLVTLSLPNKYTKWYCEIIDRAIKRNATKDIARHHILPRSFNLGGEKDKVNIANLTNREHLICHKLLVRIVTGKFKSKMWYALWILTNTANSDVRITSRQYEIMRQKIAEIHSSRVVTDETRRRLSISLAGKGVGWHHSDQAKERIGDAFRGKPGRKWSDKEKAAHSASHSGENHQNYGIPHSEQRKANIAAGVTKTYHKILVSCIHYRTVTNIGNYIKHHATYCKRAGI